MRNTVEDVIYPRERGADSADYAWKESERTTRAIIADEDIVSVA